jgi:hypothetical protein
VNWACAGRALERIRTQATRSATVKSRSRATGRVEK